jgi:DNA-binding response OmpR family regulator
MQVILVAQNYEERDILSFVLKHAGLAVGSSADLAHVVAKWLERPSDLVVVAWDSGRDLIEGIIALRAVTQIPIQVIVDPTSEDTICQLLREGADLVLTRPAAPRLVGEYSRALLRRAHTVPAFVLPHINVAEVKLDPDTRTVVVLDQPPRRLTRLEFRLLYVLMINRGQVIPTDVIVERVWGYSGQEDRNLVRGLVSRLRRKIEPDKSEPRFIHNVPGVGYRFSLEDI